MARTDELDRLKRFSEMLVASMPVPEGPGAALHTELLRGIAENKSLKAARAVVRDLLEWTQDVHGPALAELDRRLSEAQLPTLSSMRSKDDSKFAGILRRGAVASEEEYQLVNSRVIDTASSLSDSDRELAGRLLAAFEESLRGRTK